METCTAPGPLGLILPDDMNDEQSQAHYAAMATMPRFAMTSTAPTGPVKVDLTQSWKHQLVTADIGMEFPGFRQITGSCVGASNGNAVATLSFIQRLISDNPTVAFIPFWPYNYGNCRKAEGDRGQGEGAVDSVMGETIKKGVLPYGTKEMSGLPTFQSGNGLALSKQLELQWSMVNSQFSQYDAIAAKYPVGTVATVTSTEEIKQGIINGYPCLNGCSMFIGHGTVQGTGDNACVLGTYDGKGGHSTGLFGFWDHPTFGPLFLYSNQWDTSTYPADPAGGGRCTCWVKEADVTRHLFVNGNQGQTMLLSHLTYFPAQPAVLDWMMA